MKILALDTSQLQASVCVFNQSSLLASESGTTSVAHSESILPLIDGALKKAGIDLRQIELLACGVGPGSFTGLRIGCATIKAFAQSLNIKIVPFSSLDALVHSASKAFDVSSAVALVNAYQGQAFIGYYDLSGKWHEDAASPVEWCQQHKALTSADTVFLGTGVKPFQAGIEEKLGHSIKTDSVEYISAKGVFAVVQEALARPESFVSHQQLAAKYMRPSQAEVKWEQTHRSS